MQKFYQRQWGYLKAGRLLLFGIMVVIKPLLAMPQADASSSVIKSEFVFDAGTAPFAQCHASTVVESKGSLLAAWFAGTGEGHPDVGIWLSRNESGKWTPPAEVATGREPGGKRYPCWNPVLFQPKPGGLMLFFKVGPSPSQWWGMLMTSEDSGHTWTPARRLPQGMLGPIKNKPVQLSNGEILCPSSTEHAGWRVHFEHTTGDGKTWRGSPPVNDGNQFSAIQPTILFYPGNKLEALGRTRQGKIFQIWSEDSGETWGPMTATALPNPNSGIDAVTLQDGPQLLVYNHTTKGRTPLNVALSRDGHEWQAALVLEKEPGEYSYPAVIQTSGGQVHITYTWKRRSIKHVVLDPVKLETRPFNGDNWPN